MKRKNSKPAEPNGKSKKKKVEDINSKLKVGDPETLLKSLLSPVSVSNFFCDNWEQTHIHVERKDESYYGELFDLDKLYEILDEEDIAFETDINVCRYVEGQKEILNDEGTATSKGIKKKFEKEKATIQFHQPQRFVNALWNILERLERYFGCIFGANCYITPPGSQGLAPHCDDVEVFILQLSGKKAWKLYKPIDELSRHYSPDLSESEIGQPIAELTLQKGDLLYFPRGTIHQAATVADEHSLHITLSTYQNNSLGDLLSDAVKHSLEEAIQNDVEFRRGLPINFLSYLGTGKNVSTYVKHGEDNDKLNEAESQTPVEDKRVVELKEKMRNLLHRLADHLDLHVAADTLSEDYMASRLPPYAPDSADNDDEELKEENAPSLKSKIKVKHPDHVRLVIYAEDDSDSDGYEESFIEEDEVKEIEEARSKKDENGSSKRGRPQTRTKIGSDSSKTKSRKSGKEKPKSEGDDDDTSDSSDDEDDLDEESDGPHITVLHSCCNDRTSHMIGEGREGGIRLPLHFGTAVEHLLKNSSEFIPVKTLPFLDDADKEKLAVNLWSDGLLEVQS